MWVLWEWVKFTGLVLFTLALMFMTWLHLGGTGKGWDNQQREVYIAWPKSRLINFIVFHLFYFTLLFIISNFFIAGFRLELAQQEIEGYEGIVISLIFIIVGLTDLLGSKWLWGYIRKGKLGKADKAAPTIIRCLGGFLLFLGIFSVILQFIV